MQSLILLATKLISMVIIPVALLGLFGHRWRDVLAFHWNTQKHWRALVGIGIALFAFQAVFGRGLGTLNALDPSASTLAWAIPVCFIWMIFEVGFCEELPFR